MANQHTSQDDLLDANNGVDTFPPLTETPAAMSPVPHHTNAQGRTASADEHTHTAGEGDDDESWSTDSEHDDESHANVVQRITGSGADALDSRAIYHAFFGAHSSSGPSRNIGASTAKKATGIPVYKVALGTRDIESCLKLEEACFPKTGADREKIAYRLEQAGGLNIGLFTSADPDSPLAELLTYSTANTVDEQSGRRSVLVAYILVTQTDNDRILEVDTKFGHKPTGSTVAVHSFGVLPELRNQDIGDCLWKAFLQQVRSSKSYSRIAISVPTEPDMVPWFKQYKLRAIGTNSLNEAGETANVDMVIDFDLNEDSEDEEDDDLVDDADEEDEDGQAVGDELIHATRS